MLFWGSGLLGSCRCQSCGASLDPLEKCGGARCFQLFDLYKRKYIWAWCGSARQFADPIRENDPNGPLSVRTCYLHRLALSISHRRHHRRPYLRPPLPPTPSWPRAVASAPPVATNVGSPASLLVVCHHSTVCSRITICGHLNSGHRPAPICRLAVHV